jgi:ribosome-binding factor A
MTSHRRERMGDVIRDVLARVLREEVRDPRIGFVTLTDVKVTADLKLARVFYSSLAREEDRPQLRAALRKAAPFLRRAVAREAKLRYTPEIRFEEDTSLEQGFRVDELLRRLEAEHEPDPSGSRSDDGEELP